MKIIESDILRKDKEFEQSLFKFKETLKTKEKELKDIIKKKKNEKDCV